MPEFCTVEREGHQYIVTMNRPEVMNSLHPPANFELEAVFDEFVADPELGVAVITGAGGMHRLPRAIPLKHAMGMLLTGRRVSAEEGYRLGFVNEVVPEGEALAGARRWAEQILACAPLSVRASKQSAYEGLGKGSLEEACRASYDQVIKMVK